LAGNAPLVITRPERHLEPNVAALVARVPRLHPPPECAHTKMAFEESDDAIAVTALIPA
jgi:hypothetical protein